MRYKKLLESLDSRIGKSADTRRYNLSEMISESYRLYYECDEYSNTKKLVEAHLSDLRNNPGDIDRLSHQLCGIKKLVSMLENNEVKDSELLVPKDKFTKVVPDEKKVEESVKDEEEVVVEESASADDEDLLEDTELTDEEVEELTKHLAEIRKNKKVNECGEENPRDTTVECDDPKPQKFVKEAVKPRSLKKHVAECDAPKSKVTEGIFGNKKAKATDEYDEVIHKTLSQYRDADHLIESIVDIVYDASNDVFDKWGSSFEDKAFDNKSTLGGDWNPYSKKFKAKMSEIQKKKSLVDALNALKFYFEDLDTEKRSTKFIDTLEKLVIDLGNLSSASSGAIQYIDSMSRDQIMKTLNSNFELLSRRVQDAAGGNLKDSKTYESVNLSEFRKKSTGKAFMKTFKKLESKLKEGTALTRQESISLYKAANSTMTHLSVELEHNPEFLQTFNESVSLLSPDVSRLLSSLKEGKAPSKSNMKSLAKFVEALLREDEEEEELPPIEDEENEFVADEEGDMTSEEEEDFDQEYADARVELHKEMAEEHADTEDPGVVAKLAQDAEEVANLPGITDEQLADLEGEVVSTDDEESPAEDEAPEIEESAEEEITDEELEALKKHLQEMRNSKSLSENYAAVGDTIVVKKDEEDYYINHGYKSSDAGYQVTSVENYGVFVKGYKYMIPHSDYEVLEKK